MNEEAATLEPVFTGGWQSGLGNLMRSEFRKWWKSNTWWIVGLVFTSLINFILAGEAFYEGSTVDSVLMIFASYTGLLPLPGVIIVMQGVIAGERASGTVLWIMSKPVTRTAFIFAKFIPNLINILVSMVLLPGILAYVIIGLSVGAWFSPLVFAGAVLVIGLYYMFFVALTLSMGTIFIRRGVIIAIPVAFAFCQQFFINTIPFVFKLMPWTLVIPVNDDAATSVALSILLGKPVAWSTLVSVFLASVLLLYLAVRKFQRMEF